MKTICLLCVFISAFFSLSAQKAGILDYDPCTEQVSKDLQKDCLKAFSLFRSGKYTKSSAILGNLIRQDESFATPFFLMGMIGVNTDNASMIRKFFPLCRQTCEDFSHPLLWYYLGIIDYSDEDYPEAQNCFSRFLTLSEDEPAYDSLRNVAIDYLNWGDFLYNTTANPIAFFPQTIDYLSPNGNYYEPYITADESEIYFIREELVIDTVKDSFLQSNTTRKEIKMGKADRDSLSLTYDRGFSLNPPFNLGSSQSRASVSADNSLLFFSRQDKDSWNIYFCEKYGEYWSEAKPINLNTQTYNETQPYISWDGRHLLFASDRSGGKGGYDIWISELKDNNLWEEPQNMGSMINTPGDETFPVLSYDDDILYFLSNGHRTLGGSDIFYLRLGSDQAPLNLGYPVNTENNDPAIGVMPDGKTAYTTYKPEQDKYNKIVTFTLPDKARTKSCSLVKGSVHFTIDADIVLDLYNTTKNNFHHIPVSPEKTDFTLVLQDDCKYTLTFNKLGYMFCVQKLSSKQKEPLSIEIEPIEPGARMSLKDIRLNELSSDFTEETYLYTILPFVNFLQSNPHLRINLYASANLHNILEKYLLNKGIRKDRFTLTDSPDDTIVYEIQQ